MTPTEELAQAAFDGDLAKVAVLLDAGIPVDAKGRNWTPLHAAIENEHYDCVAFLIARGADVHETSCEFPPIAHAVDIAIDGTIQTGGSQGEEPTKIIQLLLNHGSDPAPGLRVARAYNSERIIQLLEAAERATVDIILTSDAT